MPKLIQGPELGQIEVSNLSAKYDPAPQGGDGLSTFMQEILPAIGQGIDKFQQENKDRLVVLGMNDEINGTVREQTVLDRKYYEQGRNVQAVVSTQAQHAQEFAARVKQAIADNAPESEIEEMRSEYNKTLVNMIYDSDIDSDLKEKLYQGAIREHADQMKQIHDTMQEARVRHEANSRGVRTSTLVSLLTTQQWDPERATNYIGQFVTQAYASKQAAGIDPLQIEDEISKEITGVFEFMTQQINGNKTSPEAIRAAQNLEVLSQTIATNPNIPLAVATKITGMVNDVRAAVYDENDTLAEAALYQKFIDATAEGDWNIDKANAMVADLHAQYESGQITYKAYVSGVKAVQSYDDAHQPKPVSEEPTAADLYNMNMTLTQFVADDYGSEDRYYAIMEQGILNEYYNDPVAAGFAMIERSINRGEDLGPLRKAGAGKVAGQFLQAIRMGPAAANREDYKNIEQNFNRFKTQYRQYVGSNAVAADDLLEGIDDEQARAAFRQVMDNNGSLMDVIHTMQKPVETKSSKANFDKQREAFTPKNLGLDSMFSLSSPLGRVAGVLNGGKFVNPVVVNEWTKAAGDVIKNSENAIVQAGVSSTNPKDLLVTARKMGLLVQSQAGYTDMALNATTSTALRSVTAKDGTVIPEYVIAHTADRTRESLAKKYGVNARDMVMSTVGNGSQYIVVKAIDSSGKSVGRKSKVHDGILIPVNNFIAAMQNKYEADKKKGLEIKRDYKVAGLGPTYYGTTYVPNKDKHFKVNTRGHFATVPIRTDKGGTLNLKIPNTATVGFNGNTALAKQFIGVLNQFESFSVNTAHVQAVGTGSKNSSNIGHQMSMNHNSSAWNAKLRRAAATGDAQTIMNVQGEFMAETLPAIQSAAKQIGIPVATASSYPPQYANVQMLLADKMWHGGPNGLKRITKVLKQPNEAAALRALRSTPEYTSAKNPESFPRNVWARRVISDYYRNKR